MPVQVTSEQETSTVGGETSVTQLIVGQQQEGVTPQESQDAGSTVEGMVTTAEVLATTPQTSG